MADGDLPKSFLVRKWMPRGDLPGPPRTIKEELLILPQGIDVPRAKTPPAPRPYKFKQKPVGPLHPDTEHVDMGGYTLLIHDGKPRNKPPEDGTMRTVEMTPEEYRMGLYPMPVPVKGANRRARGRAVPTIGSAEAAGRKHPCPQDGCRKVLTKRAHLRRHIEQLHVLQDPGRVPHLMHYFL